MRQLVVNSAILMAGLILLSFLSWVLIAAGVLSLSPGFPFFLFAVFFASDILALVVSRWPKGEDMRFVRFCSAAFCRTALPLLALALLKNYLMGVQSTPGILLAAIFYTFSLVAGVVLSIREAHIGERSGGG